MRRLAVAGAVVLLLLGGAVAAIALLADTDAARRAIERKVSESLGGNVRYDALVLRFFPRPGAEIRGVALRIPGVIEGRAAAIHVRLGILPLLAGNVRPVAVRIERPVANLRVEPRGAGDYFEAYRAAVGPAVETLVGRARGMTASLVDGRLDVEYGGRHLIAISSLAAEVKVSGDAVEAEAGGAADLWGKAQARARIAAGSLAASGSAQVTGARAAEFVVRSAGDDALRARPGPVDASLSVETDGRSMVRVTATAAAPQFVLARGAQAHDLGAVRVAGEIRKDGGTVAGAVRELEVGQLMIGATGSLHVSPDGAPPAFELKVRQLDVAQLHAAALALAGGEGAVQPWLALFTAGTVRDLSLAGAWGSVDAAASIRAIRGEARVEGATVAVPAAGIVVRDGGGRLRLADGTLQGSELKGEIGRSAFSGGTLALELQPAARLRSLRAALQADLGDALALTRHLLDRRTPAAIAGIESLAGRAAGTVDYDTSRGGSPLIVDLPKFQATGRHRGVPLPLEVTRAELRYWGAGLRVRGLAGGAGRSQVRNGNIEVVLGREPAIRSASGDAVLLLDEIFPWLGSLDPLRPVLEEVTGVTGSARVRLARLSGALARPAALEFEAAVEPEQVHIQAPALYAPLVLTGGAGEVTSRTIRLNRVAFAAGDTLGTVSGTVQDYAAADRRADLSLSAGTIGPRGMDWIRARWRLPEQAMPRAPVAITDARVQWPGPGRYPLAAQGKVRLGDGVDAEFDLAWQPEGLDLKRLALKDADTDATAGYRRTPAAIDLAFDGRLDSRTLARALVRPPAERGTIRGSFRASMDLRDPHRSTATGTLEGEGLAAGAPWDLPVMVEQFRLAADEGTLHLRDGRIAVAGQLLEASGTIAGGEKLLAIDGRLSANQLDAARLLDAFRRSQAASGPRRSQTGRWDLPLEGRIALDVAGVSFGSRVFQNVKGNVTVSPNRIVAQLTDASFCGVELPMTAVLTPGAVAATAQPRARGQALDRTLRCLGRDDLAITGTYDLDGELQASGLFESLLRTARGSFRFSSRSGRIYHAEGINRTLAVGEVASRLDAEPPKLMAQGLEYEEIALAGSLESGRVRLDQGTLDSPRVGLTVRGDITLADGSLALQGLVAPFGAVHRAARRVPVLGRVIGATLVVVPVAITGTVSDPQVKVLSAAAVGATLVNLMSARFLLPIDLLDIRGAGTPPKP